MSKCQITLDGKPNSSAVLDIVAESPWMITQATYNQLLPIAVRHAADIKLSGDDIGKLISQRSDPVTRSARAMGGNQESASGYSLHGTVARIQITGIIAPYSHMVTDVSGPRGTSVTQIRAQLEEAAADDRVGSIVLHMDTPGGNSQGIDQLATDIASVDLTKTVIAYCQGMLCSAGYYLASQATRIESVQDGVIGSIGTVSILIDSEDQFKQDGKKAIKISTSELKGSGSPGIAVTRELREMVQNLVDSTQAAFTASVASGRGVSAEVVEGEWGAVCWPASQAVERGLIDAITPDIRDLIDRMNEEYQPEQANRSRGLSQTADAVVTQSTLPAATVAGAIAATAAEPPHTPDGSPVMYFNRARLFGPSPANNVQNAAGGTAATTAPASPPSQPAQTAPAQPQLSQADIDAALQRGAQINQERIDEIQSRAGHLRRLSNNHQKMEAHISAAIADLKMTADEFSKKGTEMLVELNGPTGHAPSGTSVGAGADASDKFQQAAELVLIRRSNPELLNRAQGSGDSATRTRSALGFADAASFNRAMGDLNGSVIRSYTVMDMALHAIARNEGIDRDAARSKYYGSQHGFMSAAFHSASDFPALLANTQNKSLLAMFREQVTFYQMIARIGTAVDYKLADITSLSEAPNFREIPEGGTPDEGSFNDRREQVRVNPWGRSFSWTYQMIRNDDLNAFARFNQMVAMAASRVPDDALAASLAQNSGTGPTMSDGQALFSAAHKNLADPAAALGYEAVRTGRRAMASQVGFGDDAAPLDIEAKTLLVPTPLMDIADDLVTQEYAPGTGGANRQKNRLVGLNSQHSSRLGKTTGTANRWYLFGDPSTMPAYEIRFLDGQREPRIERITNGDPLNYRFYAVIMGFGLTAVQHEAAYSNAGA